MSRFLITVIFILICAGLILGGLYFYYKRQVSYVPEWYSLTTKDVDTSAGTPAVDSRLGEKGSTISRDARRTTDRLEDGSRSGSAQRSSKPVAEPSGVIKDSPNQPLAQFQTTADPSRTIALQLGREGSMAIRQEELMPLLLQSMSAEGSNKMAEAVKAAKATVQPGKLTMEMIVDVDKIPREELDLVGKKSLAWLQELMQKSGLNQVYLKAELYPVVQGDEMIILPQSSVSVGKIQFSLGDLHQRLGIPMHVSMDRFIFSDLQLEAGRVVISK